MTKALIWTRSQDDAPQDRALLQAAPLPVIHLPCLKSEWLEVATLPEKPCTALAVTSPRAVDGLARDTRLRALATQLPVHTFGSETAQRLTKLGARVQRHDLKNGREFGGLLAHLLPPKACLWVPGAREPAFDLVGHLRGTGIEAHAIPLYATTPTTPEPRSTAEQLRRFDELVVCFASPSAMIGFAPLLTQLPAGILERLKACAIGETTAKQARAHFPMVVEAPKPELAALIAAAAHV